jgi:opacity protein-like surface antigen
MKTRIFPIILALLMVNGVAVASDNNGLYLKGGLAYTMPVDATVNGSSLGFSLDKSLGFSLGLGYDFGQMFRIEGEWLYQKNDVDNINASGAGSAGLKNSNITYNAFLVNGILDYMVADQVGIYGVGGLGYGYVESSFYDEGSDDGVFVWKVGFGAFYDISENLAVDLGYEYLRFDNLDIGGGLELDAIFNVEITTNQVIDRDTGQLIYGCN